MSSSHAHSTSHLLTGAYRPVAEEVTVHGMPVAGRLPAELAWRFLRIGPNPVGRHHTAVDHAVDGPQRTASVPPRARAALGEGTGRRV
jgi:carotenoid cleavage dioxygenase